MLFCKYCGRQVPESEGNVCEMCLEEEFREEEQPAYPLLLAPPKPKKITKSWTSLVIISTIAGIILFFYLLGRRVFI